MKLFYLILATTVSVIVSAGENSPAADTNGIVFRPPFKLSLHVDKEHYYEQEFSKIPYVHDNIAFLFKGDAFGIDLNITNQTIQSISYQADTNKAAVAFTFAQELRDSGEGMMLLVIRNRTKHRLFFDALMTVPKREKPQKTSILPVESGLAGYESWPHPIVQLVLRNIRLTEKPVSEQNRPQQGSR